MRTVKDKYIKARKENIPIDWKNRYLGDYIELVSGQHLEADDYNEEKIGIPYFTGPSDFTNDINKILKWTEKKTKHAIFEDVLITVKGSGVGRLHFLELKKPVAIGRQLMAIRSVKSYARFLYYLLEFKAHQIEVLSMGNMIPGVTRDDILKLKSLFPPLPEQQKIARILSTWDKAIEKTEQLIAQKQLLKKGLMQQLLTGKKRLREFKGKWKRRMVGEIGTIIRGASPRPKGDLRYYGGNIPRLMVEDVTRDGKYVTPRVDFLTKEGAKLSRPCKKGTLTIVCSGDVGTPSFLAVDACIHDGFLGITDLISTIDEDFLYYQMLRLKSRIERSATHGGVFTNLTTQILKDFEIELPEFEEQRKIALIINKTDDDIMKEEHHLMLIKSQKKGLMQKLLTGAIRTKP